MPIDLGDVPVGTPPTVDQQLQIRNSIGLGTAATMASGDFITYSETPPANHDHPWFDTATGVLSIWYAPDSVWVNVSGEAGPVVIVDSSIIDGSANAVSGNAVFDVMALKAPLLSPSFTTPSLGTPSSGNLANCTFPTLDQSTTGNAATVTTNANLTGHITSVGNSASLGSFTLTQLNTAVSDANLIPESRSINGVDLSVNRTSSDLGIASRRSYQPTNFTATAYGRYHTTNAGTLVVSNPTTGTLGDIFDVVIATGSATINGVTYAASRFPIEVICTATGTPGTWATPPAIVSDQLTLGVALMLASGGTGGTTAGAARTNLKVPASDITGITGAGVVTNVITISPADYATLVAGSGTNTTTLYIITE